MKYFYCTLYYDGPRYVIWSYNGLFYRFIECGFYPHKRDNEPLEQDPFEFEYPMFGVLNIETTANSIEELKAQLL